MQEAECGASNRAQGQAKGDTFVLLPEKVFAALFRADDRAYRVAFSIFLAAVAAWTLLLIGIGPVDLIASPQDITGDLDGGWRILNGQVPHNDFYCHLGPAVPYLLGLGMAISGPNIYSVVLVLLISGLGLGTAAWLTSRRRLAPPLALLISLTVFATSVGPTPLGWNHSLTDYAMFYNRVGYATLAVLAVGCFIRGKVTGTKPYPWTTPFFAGVGLAFLLTLKISYFVVAIPAVVLAPLFLENPRRWYGWSAFGFASLALIFWLVLRVHPAAFFQDMRMVYGVARDSQSPVLPRLLELALRLWLNLAVLTIALLAAIWIRRRDLRAAGRLALAVAILVGADLLLGISNAQLPVAVLLPTEIVVLYELALRHDSAEGCFDPGDTSRFRLCLNWILLAAGVFLGVQRTMGDAISTGYALEQRIRRGSAGYPGRQIEAAPFQAVFLPAVQNGLSDYPQFINLGLELVRAHVTKRSKLVTME
jgi:hypothetical protein